MTAFLCLVLGLLVGSAIGWFAHIKYLRRKAPAPVAKAFGPWGSGGPTPPPPPSDDPPVPAPPPSNQ